ncbi:maternal B9.10 protein-like [Rhinophrynus dorsalis]
MNCTIPLEMKDEILAGVDYIKTLVNRFHHLDPLKLEMFAKKLSEILCQRYTGHWYPDKPIKGQAYRCIRSNRHQRDESIMEACAHSGFKYSDLSLPKEITLWIDPYEVSCRLGENSHPYTVASFDTKNTRTPVKSLHREELVHSSSSDCDSVCSSPSLSSSPLPSVMGDDNDSGIEGGVDEWIQSSPRTSSGQNPNDVWWSPAPEYPTQTSTPFYRTASPLWIPPWRAAEVVCGVISSPSQRYWM